MISEWRCSSNLSNWNMMTEGCRTTLAAWQMAAVLDWPCSNIVSLPVGKILLKKKTKNEIAQSLFTFSRRYLMSLKRLRKRSLIPFAVGTPIRVRWKRSCCINTQIARNMWTCVMNSLSLWSAHGLSRNLHLPAAPPTALPHFPVQRFLQSSTDLWHTDDLTLCMTHRLPWPQAWHGIPYPPTNEASPFAVNGAEANGKTCGHPF